MEPDILRQIELNDEFEAHGYPEDAAIGLEEMIADFRGSEDGEGGQGTALGNRTAATS